MSSSTLLFESGIMKISDYDPVHDRYQTRTLQLPNLPLFDQFDLPSFDSTNKSQSSISRQPSSSTLVSSLFPSSTSTAPKDIDPKKRGGIPTRRQTMSRFIECFEHVPDTSSSPISANFSTASTLRSTKSIPSKKSAKSFYSTKSPRRCYSNPNFSKKTTMKIEPLDPALVAASFKTNQVTPSPNAPKRTLSNAFHVLTGLLPKNNKRRMDHDTCMTQGYGNGDQDEDIDDDGVRSCKSVASSSTTIRQAWQGNTWLDEMKTSCDFGSRPRLASRDQAGPWWTNTPLSNSDVCVKN